MYGLETGQGFETLSPGRYIKLSCFGIFMRHNEVSSNDPVMISK